MIKILLVIPCKQLICTNVVILLMAKKKTRKSMAELLGTVKDKVIDKKEFENNLKKVLKKDSPKDQKKD